MKKSKRTSLTNPPTRRRTPEQKNVDKLVQASFTFNTTTGIVTLLNGVDDGTIPTTRIGRRITMSSLTWKFQITMAVTTTGASIIRNLIVYDKQPNGVAPIVTDILSLNSITGLMNLANSRRFVVLSDKMFNGIGTAGPQSLEDHGFAKINLETEFNDNSTNDVTSINTGAVFLVQFQDGGLLTATPTNNFYSRIRFTDV